MAKSAPKNLDSFRSVYDKSVVIPNKIKSALEAMLKEDPEHWETEQDFIKRAGVSTTDLAAYRDQFEKHIIEARATGRSAKRIWFGSTKVASQARG